MRTRFFILIAFLASASAATAQHTARNRHKQKDTLIVKAYADSLAAIKAKLDTTIRVDADTPTDARTFCLFSPTTFYHSVANRMLGNENADDTESMIDRTMMNIYLNHPQLVAKSERRVKKAGAIHKEMDAPIKDKVQFVTKTEEKPIENDFDMPFDLVVKKPNFWKYSGDYYLQMFQNYVSGNWYKGGESNYSMLGTVTLQANYNNKQRFRWENKLEMRLGLQNSKGDTLHTVRSSEDLIRYTGKVGLQATKRWYYTLQLIASTQFMRSLKSNDRTVYSDFLSPLYINPSLGMDYTVNAFKNRLTGSIHLAPIAYNLTYVKDSKLASRFGVEEGKHTKYDFGSEVTFDLAWKIADNISWKTRLYGYTSYKRVLVEWENTVTFIFNKYISSNVFIYPRFDDGAKRGKHGYMQMKEFISLGFNYGF